jgi:hypothetical protein
MFDMVSLYDGVEGLVIICVYRASDCIGLN